MAERRRKVWLVPLVLLAACLAVCPARPAPADAGTEISSDVIGSAGGQASSSSYAVHDTFGQDPIGPVAVGINVRLYDGFWSTLAVAAGGIFSIGIKLVLPLLVERKEDIPLLVDHFIDHFNHLKSRNIHGISQEALVAMVLYPWPGNIRELEHALEHAFVLCHENIITIEHIPSEIRDYKASFNKNPGQDNSDETQKITDALKQTEWNKAKAARLLVGGASTLGICPSRLASPSIRTCGADFERSPNETWSKAP